MQNQYSIFYKEVNIDPPIIKIFHSNKLYKNVHKTLTARALKVGITCYWRTYHDASLYEISNLIEFEKEIDNDRRIFTFVPVWVDKLEPDNLNKFTLINLLNSISKSASFPNELKDREGCSCGTCMPDEVRVELLKFFYENKEFRESFLNDLYLSSV